MLEDAADVGQEAHITHPVGLVQHQHLHIREVDVALADVVEQATGAGHDNLRAAAQRGQLGTLAHTAIDGRAAHPQILAQIRKGLVDLFGQFTGGGHDQHPHFAQGAAGQALEDGQGKGGGLACAGLGQTQHIPPREDERDGLFLDGGGRCVAHSFDGAVQARVERKFSKLHVSTP